MQNSANLSFFRVIFIFSLFIMASCKKSPIEDLKEAQFCLNSAPAAQAKACLEKIASDTSPQAYELRCASEFIADNKDIASLLTAMNSIKGAPTTAGAIESLKFSSTTIASSAFDQCTKSGIEIYAQISSIFNISTIASNAAGGDILTQVNNIPPATLGEIALTTYTAACTGDATTSDATAVYCNQVKNAVAVNSSDPTAIGTCLQYLLTGVGAAPSGCVVPP